MEYGPRIGLFTGGIAMLCVCAAGCGEGDDYTVEDDAGASGVGGGAATGGAKGTGGGATTGGAKGTGGATGAGGGTASAVCTGQPKWTDVSTAQIATLGGASAQSYPGGVSGTVTNRLTGDVMINIVGFGMWKSNDKGSSWARIDNNTLDEGGGRCENGWSIQIDQDNPTRMAVFTLDGSAGYTADGTTWKQWTHAPWGRNWDYGSVDWSSPDAKTIIGVEHEKSSQVVTLSTDGGTTWTELTTFDVVGASFAMVGAINATTLIGSKGTGILRSTDLGATWIPVSSTNPRSHVPVRFKDKFYLLADSGVVMSADQGVTWTKQGAAVPSVKMLQGPYFGADENTMVIGTNTDMNIGGGTSSIYKSSDGGAHWAKVTDAPTGSSFKINYVWFGGLSWDPINDLYYSTAMSNPAYRLDCTAP